MSVFDELALDVLNHLRADLARVTAERDEAIARNACDVCGGSGTPSNGRPCACGGSGRMSDAAQAMRAEWAKVAGELDAVDARLARARAVIDAVRELCLVPPGHREQWAHAYGALVDALAAHDAEAER